MLFVIATVALTSPALWQGASNIFENISYYFDPSAQRAFTYGERHFDSHDQKTYDVKRAEYFFNLAAAKDPSIQYLYHELARVSFLKGNYNRALSQIDFQISMQGDKTPNSYYVRGLIEGYMGFYDASIADYQVYLKSDPHNWAAINDYSWVLLKADRPKDAVVATDDGLKYFSDNPWLLNTNAIALYEIGDLERAREQARKALVAASGVSEKRWLTAYPGNDPRVAQEGISSFIEAARENMHTIDLALASSTIQ